MGYPQRLIGHQRLGPSSSARCTEQLPQMISADTIRNIHGKETHAVP